VGFAALHFTTKISPAWALVSRALSAMKYIAIISLLFASSFSYSEERKVDEVNQYILDAIKAHVWGGFDTPDEIQEMISDILEDGADEEMLRKSVDMEFEKKSEAEKIWPKKTDFDRLDSAFKALKNKGVLCLHNAGYTMSDGHYDSNEALDNYPKGHFFGYCFYHGQDLERAVFGGGLMLAYDHIEGDVPDKIKVAEALKSELVNVGFTVEWDGTTDQRIYIPKFDWKHRGTNK
jgi:hypothetical protein